MLSNTQIRIFIHLTQINLLHCVINPPPRFNQYYCLMLHEQSILSINYTSGRHTRSPAGKPKWQEPHQDSCHSYMDIIYSVVMQSIPVRYHPLACAYFHAACFIRCVMFRTIYSFRSSSPSESTLSFGHTRLIYR